MHRLQQINFNSDLQNVAVVFNTEHPELTFVVFDIIQTNMMFVDPESLNFKVEDYEVVSQLYSIAKQMTKPVSSNEFSYFYQGHKINLSWIYFFQHPDKYNLHETIIILRGIRDKFIDQLNDANVYYIKAALKPLGDWLFFLENI